jgi:hypothetical protein
LRKDTWSLALDQRVFGPGRLLVAFAKRSGLLVTIAYTRRSDPPEMALDPCIQHCGRGAAAAVALCDEAVAPPPELAPRFALARSIAASHGNHLVDWIACDDQLFRSSRIAVYPDDDGWDFP